MKTEQGRDKEGERGRGREKGKKREREKENRSFKKGEEKTINNKRQVREKTTKRCNSEERRN